MPTIRSEDGFHMNSIAGAKAVLARNPGPIATQ
jgi:hypothetical protein